MSLTAPVNRKRATVVLALAGYLNTAIVMVQGFLLIPLYLRFIGAHLYGLWLSSGGILAMLGVMQFGLGNLLVQRVAHAYGRENLPRAGAYFVNGMFVYLVITSVFTVAGMATSFALDVFLRSPGGDESLAGCFRLAVVAAGIGIINEGLRGFAQALLRPLFSTVALALFRVVGTVATILLLYNEAGLWAIPIGMLLTELLSCAVTVLQTLALFRGLHAGVRLESAVVREYFQVGSALLLAKMGNVVSRECDPVLITLFLRPEITTAYMATRRAADIVFGILNVMYTSAFGTFSHLAGEGDLARTREVACRVFAFTSILGLVGYVSYVALDYSFVSLWVGEKFALDRGVILCIGVAFFVYSLRNFVIQTLNGLGHFNYTSAVVFCEGLGKVVLASLLLQHFGVIGVPLALIPVSCISIVVVGLELRELIQLEIGPLDLVRVGGMLVVLFSLGQTFATLLDPPASWFLFASLAAMVLLAASLTCSLFHRPLFRDLIQECLCRR